jgi:lipid-A-disaccharide synthase
MVAAYTVTLIEELIARAFVTAPSAILTNLILGENVVPEFLQRDCTVENLSSTLVKLVQDTPERRRQTDAFARLDDIMQIGKAVPSARAAQHVFETAINHAHASGE